MELSHVPLFLGGTYRAVPGKAVVRASAPDLIPHMAQLHMATVLLAPLKESCGTLAATEPWFEDDSSSGSSSHKVHCLLVE